MCSIHADEKRGAVQIERVNRHINICPESKQNKIGFFSADFSRVFFFKLVYMNVVHRSRVTCAVYVYVRTYGSSGYK